MKIFLILATGGILAVLLSAGCAAVRAGYASAPYKVVRRDGKFEVRDYPALVVAETPMRGADNSFMRLFHFIGGENAAKKKISMTTPVFMTGSGTNATMAFVMPAQTGPPGIPQPTEPGVTIKTIAGGSFAVLRFSGGRSSKNETNAIARLAVWVTQERLSSADGPVFAYFDPPWTPSFLRRNEVMFRVTQP